MTPVDGDYLFTVSFDDGQVETYPVSFRQITVTPVSGATMAYTIHPNGAMTFSWDLPFGMPGKDYDVRLRSTDGSQEYFKSSNLFNSTDTTASAGDLRALEHGREYQWFVRASEPWTIPVWPKAQV